jgi:DnaJ-class molecular chaperone
MPMPPLIDMRYWHWRPPNHIGVARISCLVLCKMQREKQMVCSACAGRGSTNPDSVMTCTKCRGFGRVLERQTLGPGFVVQNEVPYVYHAMQAVTWLTHWLIGSLAHWIDRCPTCGGAGSVPKEPCHKCAGRRVVLGVFDFTVQVPAGAPDGHTVVCLGVTMACNAPTQSAC